MMWGMSGMMGFAVLAWLVVILAIVAGVWWVVRNVAPGHRNSALDILRERYARGEISREEYESRRRDLAA
jgi:putative membrane protein